nr:ComEC/Rec2 family competence protein [Kineococcus siccus]
MRAACAGLPADARGLLPGLVVGDTSLLPPDLEAAMRAVGLTHLTAVSGSNTTLVVGALVALAGWLGAGRRTRLVLAGAGLAGFVVLARPEPSVLRAAVMGGIGLVGVFAGRPSRGAPVLFGAVVVLLVVDPWLSRQYGFVLSVLATLALLLLARPWAERLVRAGWPRWAAFAVAVPTAAQAVCGPVVALLQPSVNLLAVPANVVVAPAVAPATVLGLTATVVAVPWPGAASVLVWPAGLAAQWIALVARSAASLPTSVPLPSGVRGAALLAGLTVLVLVLVVSLPPLWRRLGARRTVAGLVVVVLLAVLLTRCTVRSGAPAGPWPVPDWLVVGCDVGQGDALLLRSGPDSAVLVDAGPDGELVDGCLDRLGVRRLDAVLLSHLHADHVDGLAGALAGRSVGRVWTSPLQPPGAVEDGLRAALDDAGARLEVASAGTSGRAGAVSWTVLWPPAGVAELTSPDSSEVNDSSLVVLADVGGVRVLLTGDLETGAQARLAATSPRWPGGARVDVVKVAHHGSARQDPRLYEAARPRVALVEVGAANDYGHPSPEALSVLDAVGARTLRTDRDGDLAVAGTAQALRTVVRGSDPRDAARRDRYGVG